MTTEKTNRKQQKLENQNGEENNSLDNSSDKQRKMQTGRPGYGWEIET